MRQYLPSRSPCPIGRASRVLGDRWTLLILREMFLGCDRFEQFIERLSISRAALTSRLAILIEAELVQRDPPEGKRGRYVLTQAGEDLRPVYKVMADWALAHLFEGDGKRPGWMVDQS